MSTAETRDPQLPPAEPFVVRQGGRGPAWFVVLLPLVPPLLLWLASGAAGSGFSTPATALRSIGIVAGLCGYAGFATTLVLAARLPAVEKLMVSLDRMYRFHRRLGATVGALLVTHAGAMLASRALTPDASAVDLLRPDAAWAVFPGVVAFLALLTVLAASRLLRQRHETFLRVHRLFGVVYAVAAVHVLRVPGASPSGSALQWYLWLVTAAGVAAWIYRSGLGLVLVRRHHYRVARVTPLDATVVELALDPVEEPLRFAPGQLVFIGVDDPAVGRELHPFSITSRPDETELRVVVKAVGDFTRALPDVDPGAWVRVEGPYGGFWHDGRRYRRQVWIAGGIGVTPFLSMARSLTDGPAIDFFYCTEDVDAALFLDELWGIADVHPRLRVVPMPATTMGFLTAADVAAVAGGPDGDLSGVDVFLCGPPAMIDALVGQLADLGVPRERVHYEDFRLTGR